MGLFGKKKDPKEQAKEWKAGLRREIRGLDRQLRGIEQAEAKTKAEVRKAAQGNDQYTVKTLARELVRSRKAKNRIMTAKTQLNSVLMEVQHQMATLRIAGALQQSTSVMETMNEAVKMPEIREVMKSMSKEMARAGMVSEAIDETMDDALEVSDEEEETEAEMSKIIDEVISGQMAGVGAVGTTVAQRRVAAKEEDAEAEDLSARMAALTG